MLHQFDHRFGDYRDQPQGSENTHLPDVPLARLQDQSYQVLPRYWVPEAEVAARLAGRWDRGWLLGWRDICRNTDQRTVIAGVLPRMGVGHTYPLMLPADPDPGRACCLYANLAALPFDYAARQKIGGTHLTYGFLNQLPVLPPEAYAGSCPWAQPSSPRPALGGAPSSPRPSSPARGEEGEAPLRDWIAARVLELTYTAWDLQPFARDLGYEGPPFVWDEARRFLLRCELDAASFHLYGIEREDVDYILETFPIVKRKDLAAHGTYRTKDMILQLYDAMAAAMRTGEPYRTPLDPGPAETRGVNAKPAGWSES